MIVYCAYCRPLPLADLEALGDDAWKKHLRSDEHLRAINEWATGNAHIDGPGCG